MFGPKPGLVLWFASVLKDLPPSRVGWVTAVECGDRGSGGFAIEVSDGTTHNHNHNRNHNHNHNHNNNNNQNPQP